MSSLFEQQLYLLGDIIALDVMERNGWTEADIKAHHANLE
jgi:6-phospho-3-hexuloisomerase